MGISRLGQVIRLIGRDDTLNQGMANHIVCTEEGKGDPINVFKNLENMTKARLLVARQINLG